MTAETIRVGVIGAGGNTTKLHIPGLQKQKGVEIVAVVNRTPASGRRVAEAHGIPTVHDDWRSLLADGAIDAVCIGTWPYTHAAMTIAALAAGKHVLCEARMAMNHDEAKAMLAAARAAPHLTAQIVPAPHTLAFDRTIVEMIAGGHIGELIAIDARVAAARSYPNGSGPQHWRQNRTLSGDNIMNMGIWYEAMMRWVGPAKSVAAVGQSVVRHRLNEAGARTAMAIPRPYRRDRRDGAGRADALQRLRRAWPCAGPGGRAHFRDRRHVALAPTCRRADGPIGRQARRR